ncbi:MAG: YIP1 family protein [Thermoproteota archaeon]|nr:YIP1 family protein [Candidatus Brockarchaeota archaeon]MBO3802164.1 YIP1 family protein [Candidatus Brockarchaeota archaeon]
MSNSQKENSGSSEIELEKEAQLPAPVKTIRRMVLTIFNPMLAMKLIAKDPDWFIVPLMFVVLALFSFLQPIVVMSKMNGPGNMTLYVPNVNKTLTLNDLKSDAQKIYWSTNLMFYLISILIGIIILVLISKILFGKTEYKSVISGTSYASLTFVILGIIWLILMLSVPPVNINYKVYNNESFIVWPKGIKILWPSSYNLSLKDDSKIILPNGTYTTLTSYLDSSEANGSKILWSNGTSVISLNKTEIIFFNGSANTLVWKNGTMYEQYTIRNNTTFVLWLNGSRFIFFNETRADPVSVMKYFSEGLTSNTPKALSSVLGMILPNITRIWQSILLIILIKEAQETSWIKAILAVFIQQALLFILMI